MNLGKKVNICRMCKSQNIFQFIDLGFAPLTDGILNEVERNEPEVYYPLQIFQCSNCGLSQIGYIVNEEIRYGKSFKYESSITETGKQHYHTMANSICENFKFPNNSLIVDIGSNVGVLLDAFKQNGMEVLGIEPVPHIAYTACKNDIDTWDEFFGPKVAKKIIEEKGKAKIITITNVFGHIDYKIKLMEAVENIMDEDGIFVIETPYFADMIQNFEYDKILHEHTSYDSIKPMVPFFALFDMEIFDVERNNIQGGSIRVFVARKGKYLISNNVQKLLTHEEEVGIYNKEKLSEFSLFVKSHKENFILLLNDLKNKGHRIVGISAPAKGNTILNYCKIGTELIDYITEKSEIKIGHYTPGMHIPIVSEEKLKKDNPSYAIIFAWNFAKEIMKNNENFLESGGKFIIPFPTPHIVDRLN